MRLPSKAACTPLSLSFFDVVMSASKNSFRNELAARWRARRSVSSLVRLASSSATALSSADMPPPRTAALSDRAFEADRNELLRLDGELHRKLLQHVLDEAVDDQRHRLL